MVFTICCRSDEDSPGKNSQPSVVKNAVGTGKGGGTTALLSNRDVCAAGGHGVRIIGASELFTTPTASTACFAVCFYLKFSLYNWCEQKILSEIAQHVKR